MVAIVYARVSSEDQARTGFSLASQVEAGRRHAGALGTPEVAEYADEGVPGDVLERPGLQAALARVGAGGVSHFICYDPDRLARSLSLQLVVTEQIERAGTRLEFVNFEYRTTPEGQLFYALRGAISQYEKAKIRERTMRGKRQKARTGGMTHNPGIYGYDFDPASDRLSVNEERAQVVRLIFRWFLEGAGPWAIARRLTALGIPPARGGRAWHHASVRNILRNRSYTGLYHQQMWDYSETRTNKYRPPGQKVRRKLRPASEWVAVPIPAIVSEAVFAEARARDAGQARPGRTWTGERKPEYLLSGVARCALCGRPVAGARRGERRYYVCRGYAPGRPGEPRCPFGRVPAEPLEMAVWGALEPLIRSVLEHAGPAELGAAPAHVPLADEMSLVARQLADLRAAHERTAGLVARGAVDPDVGEALLREQRERLAALQVEVQRLEAKATGEHLAEGGNLVGTGSPARVMTPRPGQLDPGAADLARLPPGIRQALTRTLLREAILTRDSAILRTWQAPR
jgi:site-specific DNA recombinase